MNNPEVSDQTIASTVRALLSQSYNFEAFLTDRASGAKERIRQQIKNKKRYDAKKALKESKKQAEVQKLDVINNSDSG